MLGLVIRGLRLVFLFGLALPYIIRCDVTLVHVQLYHACEKNGVVHGGVVRAGVIQPPVARGW